MVVMDELIMKKRKTTQKVIQMQEAKMINDLDSKANKSQQQQLQVF